jgi:N-acetylmuramic acid 6-phosphate etherase
MEEQRITEQPGAYRHLEHMPVGDLLQAMNREDQGVAEAVRQALPQVEAFVAAVEADFLAGGRLFYIGSGTSGRLGILDASEVPPTFGVGHNRVIGLIAGGDAAIRQAQEFAEDDTGQAWRDLLVYGPSKGDAVLGISASGTTPYVLGGLRAAASQGLHTGALSCNPEAAVSALALYPIEVVTGPEVVTGSTRLKAGTAQKMVLNMISTALMVRSGRVQDNQMVDMQLTNRKLIERGTRILAALYDWSYQEAREALLAAGSVRKAIQHQNRQTH